VLHDHILKGYTVNAQRLAALQQTIRLISNVVDQRSLGGDEAAAMLRVLRDYADALNVLDAYDHGNVPQPEKGLKKTEPLSLQEARRVVKNHPFVDGNKRIGAALFLRFLEKNSAHLSE